jgi:hypothetical protein
MEKYGLGCPTICLQKKWDYQTQPIHQIMEMVLLGNGAGTTIHHLVIMTAMMTV